MAHDLFQGTMAYVGAIPGEPPPWHGLGKLVSADVTAEEMIVAANLGWMVWKEPAPGARLRTEDPETYDRYLVMREPVGPDEACSVALGMVTSAYEPVQNHEAFAFFEPFIENRWASFSTAGALGNGERIWVMARLVGDIEIAPDDIVERYLLLSTSHHGKGAVSIRFTPIRVVCQNTLNLAMRGGTGVCTIRHTPYVRAHLRKAQAEELRRISEKVFDGAQQRFRAMADRRMQTPEMFAYLDRVFPRTRLQEQRNRTPHSWDAVWRILEDERVTPRGTEDTLWAVYNAVVRYEDYRPTDERLEESRLARVWFGRGRGLKLRALNAAKAFLN